MELAYHLIIVTPKMFYSFVISIPFTSTYLSKLGGKLVHPNKKNNNPLNLIILARSSLNKCQRVQEKRRGEQKKV